jgi:hypothetical protein
VRVHSVLPRELAAAVDAVLSGHVEHVAHGDTDDLRAAEAAAGDPEAIALIGPFRSRAVAEALEATRPAGLPLLAPVATWAGVTRDDEPGCEDDPARHDGTVLRMVARDTEVAMRLAAYLRAEGQRALVVAGDHEYGEQLDRQLELAGLPRVEGAPGPGAAPGGPAEATGGADVVVLCGLSGSPEVGHAAAAGLPVIAFDGIQDGDPIPDLRLALPFAPGEGLTSAARRAAELVVAAVRGGAADRASLLAALRELGPFDEHGDPIRPPVWLYRAAPDWSLEPDRAL